MAKMSNKMVGLCSAAIGAIYLTGFAATQEKDTRSSQQPSSAVSKHQAVQQHISQQPSRQPKQALNQSIPKTQVSKKKNRVYKDGTFTGEASNRIGSVTVAVTIKQDKITGVDITSCDTHYSQARIDGLPQEVLSRQSDQVDYVSGATLSSEDFQYAVADALQTAKL